jgi:predicted lipase
VGYSPSHHAIIAAFRGSVDLQNWLANVDVIQVTYSRCSNCKVHKGFYDAYKMVMGYVNAQVTLLRGKYDNPKIYVAGHSLGGALAVMAASELKAAFGSVDQVYTTGQPRVGNSYFAAYLTNTFNLYRLVHWADLVPHCPASGAIMAFKHGGT